MLTALKNALTATGISFAHFGWDVAPPGDYGVYAEDAAGHFYADNQMTSQSCEGTVDLFTRAEGDTAKNKVQTALDSIGCSWRLNSVQYEEDTRYIHYEWVFEVL